MQSLRLVLSRSKVGPQSRPDNYLCRRQVHLHTKPDGVNHFAIVQVVALFVVNTEYTSRADKFGLVT
jgi:hypothetical protein